MLLCGWASHSTWLWWACAPHRPKASWRGCGTPWSAQQWLGASLQWAGRFPSARRHVVQTDTRMRKTYLPLCDLGCEKRENLHMDEMKSNLKCSLLTMKHIKWCKIHLQTHRGSCQRRPQRDLLVWERRVSLRSQAAASRLGAAGTSTRRWPDSR